MTGQFHQKRVESRDQILCRHLIQVIEGQLTQSQTIHHLHGKRGLILSHQKGLVTSQDLGRIPIHQRGQIVNQHQSHILSHQRDLTGSQDLGHILSRQRDLSINQDLGHNLSRQKDLTTNQDQGHRLSHQRGQSLNQDQSHILSPQRDHITDQDLGPTQRQKDKLKDIPLQNLIKGKSLKPDCVHDQDLLKSTGHDCHFEQVKRQFDQEIVIMISSCFPTKLFCYTLPQHASQKCCDTQKKLG